MKKVFHKHGLICVWDLGGPSWVVRVGLFVLGSKGEHRSGSRRTKALRWERAWGVGETRAEEGNAGRGEWWERTFGR